MADLIGFFGTHGVGKTTLCEELKRRGHAIDIASVPRAAQTRLGWPNLSPVTESEENMWAMQDMTLKLLIERDCRIRDSGVSTFVDRTPVDLAGYVKLWATRLEWSIDQSRYDAYMAALTQACDGYSVQFFVPIRKEIPFVPQPNRGDEAGRELNQKFMEEFAILLPRQVYQLPQLAISDRADFIESAFDWVRFHSVRPLAKQRGIKMEVRELLDGDGENRAVRSFLSLYGGSNGGAIDTKTMRYHIEMAGFPGAWPEWAKEDQTLTKAGAQLWLRFLFNLENSLAVSNREGTEL